jgi:Tol biopolymer transport system component
VRRRHTLAALTLTPPWFAGLAACGSGRGGSGPKSGAAQALVFAAEGNIQALGFDGKGRKALTKVPQGALARDPAWSPDAQRIAYAYSPPLPAARGPGGLLPLPVTGVYVMNADGSSQTVAIPHQTPGVGHETPVWARDGKSFYVTYSELLMESNVVKDQVVEVAKVTPGVAQRQTLIPNGAFPALSPDGTRLACVVTARDGQSLVVATADGKNVRALIAGGQMEGLSSPRFAPDGKQLVFSAVAPIGPAPTVTPFPRRSGVDDLGGLFLPRAAEAHGLPMDLFVISLDGGAPRRLTEIGEDSPAAVWSPDGKRLAMLAGGGVYVVQSNGQDLMAIDTKGGHGSIDWKPA